MAARDPSEGHGAASAERQNVERDRSENGTRSRSTASNRYLASAPATKLPLGVGSVKLGRQTTGAI